MAKRIFSLLDELVKIWHVIYSSLPHNQSEISALGSLDRAARLVVYDLGMGEEQSSSLQEGFSNMGASVVFKKLDYSKYPPHIDISKRNGAWKV